MSKELKAFQVGDNDIVAAYTPEEAKKVLTDYVGDDYVDEFFTVEEVSKTLKLADEEGEFQQTLGDFMKGTEQPMYLLGWE